MTLKRTRFISTIGIFALCFLFHFIYDWLPCSLTAIFFPVNESIWEHMKLLFSAVVFYGIIDYIILQKFKIKYNNFFTSLFVSALTIIPIYLIMFLPIYHKIGENMAITIGIMLVSIIISQVISYYILKAKDFDKLNIISLILIIISYIVFAFLTYYPIKNELFFDTQEEKYGINNYNI
ncbi:MAG: hypothetical protein IJY25_06525 [Bacilli bacterium]|nr:hypothetical protein [Bacilli bacterium]